MIQYIIVNPQGGLTSAQRAKAISREIYCITSPRAVQEQYQHDRLAFNVITHPGQDVTCLEIDTAYNIPVHPLASLERLVPLFPEITEAERLNLTAFIYSRGSFTFSEIIPSGVIVRTRQEMESLGWFASDDL